MIGMLKKGKVLGSIALSLLMVIIVSCSATIDDSGQGKGNGSTQNELMGAGSSAHPLGALPEKPETLQKVGTSAPAATRLVLPSSVDLSSDMPPVGDQGQQGSCVAWAVGYDQKTHMEKIAEEWDVSESLQQFSPSWIYNQINGGTDRGSYISDALNLLYNKGCDLLYYFPYDQNNFTRQPDADSFERASHYKNNTTWSFLKNDVNSIKQVLAGGETVVFSCGVYPDFDNLNSANPVYDDASGICRGYHALCIVGYDDSMQAFKFINSWGTSWGINGYGWLSYNFVKDGSPIAFTAFYGMDGPNTPFTQKLSSPLNGAQIIYGTLMTFSWMPVPGAVYYELEIIDKNNVSVKYNVNQPNPVTTLSCATHMMAYGNYTWKVTYYKADGSHYSSEIRNFTIYNTGSLTASPSCIKLRTGTSANILISWNSTSPQAAVYYSDNGGPETFLAGYPSMSNVITGQIGHNYIFNLYDNTTKTMLLDTKASKIIQKWVDDVVTFSSGSLNVLTGKGPGFNSPVSWLNSLNNVSNLTVGDFNGDGLDDLFCLASLNFYTPYQLNMFPSLYLSDGTKFNATSFTTTFGTIYKSAAADIDGDGMDELITEEPNPYYASEHILKAYKYANHAFTTLPLSITVVAGCWTLGDFNNDGKWDIAYYKNGNIYVCLSPGFSQPAVWTACPIVTGMAAGDFDGDGKDDLFITGTASVYGYGINWTVNSIYKSTGSSFSSAITVNPPSGFTNFISGDFNKDGKSELGFLVDHIVSYSGQYGPIHFTTLNVYQLSGNTMVDSGISIGVSGLTATGNFDGK